MKYIALKFVSGFSPSFDKEQNGEFVNTTNSPDKFEIKSTVSLYRAALALQ